MSSSGGKISHGYEEEVNTNIQAFEQFLMRPSIEESRHDINNDFDGGFCQNQQYQDDEGCDSLEDGAYGTAGCGNVDQYDEMMLGNTSE